MMVMMMIMMIAMMMIMIMTGSVFNNADETDDGHDDNDR